jgi:uncharacterized phage infection (PIP) family protein YhgE
MEDAMVDGRTIAHEVQEQLMGAVQRGQKELRRRQEQLRKGQEQLRKGQEQLRKGQEQLRKGQESVNVAIRTGNELAKSVRPNLTALQAKGLHLPHIAPLTSPAKLREHAQGLAGQVVATQRNIAGKALQAATPLVTDGVARLNKVVSLLEERERREAEKPAVASVADEDTAAPEAAAPKAAAKPKAAAPKDAGPKPAKPRSTPAATKAAGTTKASSTKPKN